MESTFGVRVFIAGQQVLVCLFEVGGKQGFSGGQETTPWIRGCSCLSQQNPSVCLGCFCTNMSCPQAAVAASPAKADVPKLSGVACGQVLCLLHIPVLGAAGL